MSDDLERITTAVPVEVRAGVGGASSRMIGGYAFLFNRLSENLGGYVERINTSFPNHSRSLGWPGVVARYNHDDAYVLGSTRSGTLRLSTDETGLDYCVDVPECRGDVLEMVTRGDVANSSFAFIVQEDDWSVSEQGYPMRTLLSGKLIDVAPVLTPAYRDSTVGLRSLARKMNTEVAEVQQLAKANELRKFFVRTDGGGAPEPKRPRMSGAQAKLKLLQKRSTDPLGGAKK
jgi:HK97 family phage prohead protease